MLACGLGSFNAQLPSGIIKTRSSIASTLLSASGVVSAADSVLPVSELASEVAASWLASDAGASSEGAASALASVAVAASADN